MGTKLKGNKMKWEQNKMGTKWKGNKNERENAIRSEISDYVLNH